MMYGKPNATPDQALIEKYAVLVKRIAHHLMGRLPQNISLDDLIQAGMIGLLEALRKYDGGRGASFETYAGIRIRGAMLDEVRKTDWAPRSVHRQGREVSHTIRYLENALGRPATDREIAEHMGIPLNDYYQIINDSVSSRLFSFEQVVMGDTEVEHLAESGPAEGFSRDEMRRSLTDAIKQLPEREALVLSLYYDEELNLKEIGLVLGVSESRVSQIHSQAMARLRAKLRDWQDE